MPGRIACRRAALLALAMFALGIARVDSAEADRVLTTAIKLQTPKKSESRTSGELDEVPISIWIPGGVEQVRGAFVNPFYIPLVERTDYQRLARVYDFALVGANFFGVKNGDYPALLKALAQFAEESGRPEIEHLPLCFNGMSAGAGMSVKFGEIMPERVIAISAVCLEVGPRSEEARKIPTLTIFGERDGRQMEILDEKLPNERAEGALWTTAPQWGLRHDYANANWLVWPFFDAVIHRRLPDDAPKDGPVKLRDYAESDGWLGDRKTWDTNWARIAPYGEYDGDKTTACWFPNAYVATVWRAFVSKRPPVSITVEPADDPGSVKIAAEDPPAGLKEIRFYAGDELLGEATRPPFEIETDKVARGVQAVCGVYVISENVKGATKPVLLVNGADPKSDAARATVE